MITINFEDFDYMELRDPRKLYAYIEECLAKDGITYVFLDEIQHVKDFPDVVNSLFIKPNVDLYLTVRTPICFRVRLLL